MKTFGPRTAAILTIVLTILAVTAYAQAPAGKPGQPAAPSSGAPRNAAKRIVVRGEVLDLGCFLSHGLRGSLHRDCARQCLSVGVPMGLLAEDSTVYLLTQDHGRAMAPSQYQTADGYAQCREWASETVEITGAASERDGVHVLEILRAKLVPAPAPTAGATKTP